MKDVSLKGACWAEAYNRQRHVVVYLKTSSYEQTIDLPCWPWQNTDETSCSKYLLCVLGGRYWWRLHLRRHLVSMNSSVASCRCEVVLIPNCLTSFCLLAVADHSDPLEQLRTLLLLSPWHFDDLQHALNSKLMTLRNTTRYEIKRGVWYEMMIPCDLENMFRKAHPCSSTRTLSRTHSNTTTNNNHSYRL